MGSFILELKWKEPHEILLLVGRVLYSFAGLATVPVPVHAPAAAAAVFKIGIIIIIILFDIIYFWHNALQKKKIRSCWIGQISTALAALRHFKWRKPIKCKINSVDAKNMSHPKNIGIRSGENNVAKKEYLSGRSWFKQNETPQYIQTIKNWSEKKEAEKNIWNFHKTLYIFLTLFLPRWSQ